MMKTALTLMVSCAVLVSSDTNELNWSDGQEVDTSLPISVENPPIPPAFTADDFAQLDGEAVLGAKAVKDILGRRRLGLPIPDKYYEQCHFWVNTVRAREGLPALQRWKDFESCSDEMAEYDYFQHRDYGRAHAALYDGVGCDFFATGNGPFAQNSCPRWIGDGLESIQRCTIAMWEEKETPGVDPDTLRCLGRSEAECGHYFNLRGGDAPGKYNTYDKVACGFYVNPDSERLYINQNFGAGSNFACGGDESTKPNTNVLVPDCSMSVPNDYSGCSGLDGFVDKDYHTYACELVDCDLEYDGPCENRLVNDFDACRHFDITKPEDCEPNRFWRYNHPDSPKYYFNEYCRVPCKKCSCEDKLNGIYNTRAPTPTPPPGSPTMSPTAHCDPDYTGVCADAMPELCEKERIAEDLPCNPRWRFSATGTYVIDECRKSCGACSCDGSLPAPTPSPVPSPTKRPTDDPTPSPTQRPTNDPTQSPTKRPTQDPTPSPTQDPTQRPTMNPTKRPTDDPTPSPTQRPTEDDMGSSPVTAPTPAPVDEPQTTPAPTESPTNNPTEQPTQDPTPSPTKRPTQDPTPSPTKRPTQDPTPSPVPSPTFLVTDPPSSDKCPWLTPTDGRAKLECQDGSFCNGWADGWSCCKSRGGRKRCPADMPLMCVDTCNGTNCCGGDHCCETDCATAGGELPCDEPVVTPAPTDLPTQSPTDSPTQSPTPSPTTLPCDDLQVGIPQGSRTRVADVETACECAAQCSGQRGFVHFPRRNRCWCVESFDGNVSDTDAERKSQRFYQLWTQDEAEA